MSSSIKWMQLEIIIILSKICQKGKYFIFSLICGSHALLDMQNHTCMHIAWKQRRDWG